MSKKDYEAPLEYTAATKNESMSKSLHHVTWRVAYNYPNAPLEISVEFTTVSEWLDRTTTVDKISSTIDCDSVSIKKLKNGDMQLVATAQYPQTANIYGAEPVIVQNNIFNRFKNYISTKYSTGPGVDLGYRNFKLDCDDDKKIFKLSVIFTNKLSLSNV